MKDDDHIGALTTIRRNCKLSDGVYTIKLGPEPGNMNIQGHCGAWMSAWAEVRKGKQILYPRTDFENGVGCYYEDGVITTRIEISPHTRQPKLTIHPAVELLSGL
jgi:hypothetical protein